MDFAKHASMTYVSSPDLMSADVRIIPKSLAV